MKVPREKIVITEKDRDALADDPSIVRIVVKPGEVGNFDLGPVLVIHGLLDKRGTEYAHAFGPYPTIRDAIETIETRDAESGDRCIKSIIRLIPDPEGGMAVIDVAELIAAGTAGVPVEVPATKPQAPGKPSGDLLN